jgi:DNA-binding CsgD family transcriptional regulator
MKVGAAPRSGSDRWYGRQHPRHEAPLTARQWEVLAALATHGTDQEASMAALGLGPKGLASARNRIYRRIGARWYGDPATVAAVWLWQIARRGVRGPA